MTKYVVHLNPTIDGTGKDMPNTFEIDAASFLIEEGIAVFRTGAIVAAFPQHSYRAVVQAGAAVVKVNRAASAEA